MHIPCGKNMPYLYGVATGIVGIYEVYTREEMVKNREVTGRASGPRSHEVSASMWVI